MIINLSPYEKDRMVPNALGQTGLGRDLLAEDYMLKQLTASLIYPEKDLGKEFWNRVYTKARQLYGSSQVPVNTFNKVWILADKATVYEHGQTAFVINGHLKVMLEEDYLSLQKHYVETQRKNAFAKPSNREYFMASHNRDAINGVSTKRMMQEIILPEIEKEVNQGKNFATLRQIFNSQILATWYKKTLKEALINQVYTDKSKIKGIERQTIPPLFYKEGKGELKPSKKDLSPEAIYQQYLKAYKKGVFNYIKEDPDPKASSIPRKYFSGGYGSALGQNLKLITSDMPETQAMVTQAMSTFNQLTDLKVALFLNRASVPAAFKQNHTAAMRSNQDKKTGSDIPEESRLRIIRELYHQPVENGLVHVPEIESRFPIINSEEGMEFIRQLPGVAYADLWEDPRFNLVRDLRMRVDEDKFKAHLRTVLGIGQNDEKSAVPGPFKTARGDMIMWIKPFDIIDGNRVGRTDNGKWKIVSKGQVLILKGKGQMSHGVASADMVGGGFSRNGEWLFIQTLYGQGIVKGLSNGSDQYIRNPNLYPDKVSEDFGNALISVGKKENGLVMISAEITNDRREVKVSRGLKLPNGEYKTEQIGVIKLKNLANRVAIGARDVVITVDIDNKVEFWGIDALEKASASIGGKDENKAMKPAHNINGESAAKGGIDLNTLNMSMAVSKDGKGVEMTIDPAMIARVRREGVDSLTPVIYRMIPISNIWPLAGFQAPV